MNALAKQVSGNHYKSMAIQPIEFSMGNGLDACVHSTIKYIVRHAQKGGRSDLEKALHFVELREQVGVHNTRTWTIPMFEFCRANNVPPEESSVLIALFVWVTSGLRQHLFLLKEELRQLIELRYPQPAAEQPPMTTTDALTGLMKIVESDVDLSVDSNVVVGVFKGIGKAQRLCHFLASRSGWWTDMATGERRTLDQVNVPEKLMLIVSEVAEAMEGHRRNRMDDKLPDRPMLEVELADTLIRVFDLAGFLQLDMAGAVIEKLAFNQQRADHKIENRLAVGGKKF